MFNRYWRSYPWYFQLLQFIILIAVMASFFVFALTPLLMNMMGVAITDIPGGIEVRDPSQNLVKLLVS